MPRSRMTRLRHWRPRIAAVQIDDSPVSQVINFCFDCLIDGVVLRRGVGSAATRFHYGNCWIGGGMAARNPRAATGYAGRWLSRNRVADHEREPCGRLPPRPE